VAVVELTGSPRPSAVYARAAIGLVPGTGRRRGVLPGLELVRRGVIADREHLARYNRVCGFRLTDALPATFPHILAFPLAMRLMSARDFPFPVVGLVHVANRITIHRAIDAGTPLDFSVRALDLREHDRGRQFDIVVTATADGARVWHGISTYLAKQRPAEPRRKSDHRPAPAGSALWQLPVRTGTDYAAVSGDHNPIHTSRLGARLFGFRRPIAHGMWSMARCLAGLEGRLPSAYTVGVSFKLPILLPAQVSFVTGPAGDGWEFALYGARDGRPHLAGELTHP